MTAVAGVLRRTGPAAALGAVALVVTLVPFGRPEPRAPARASGERLAYAVFFMGIRAGTLELRTAGEEEVDGAACLVIEMKIYSTNAILEALFPVRESWRTWVDREGGFSWGSEVVRRHGTNELEETQTFDYERRVSRWSRTEAGRVETGEVELPGRVQDPVSWVRHVRERVAAGERELRFFIVDGGKVNLAELRLAGEEEIDLGALGSLRALRFSGSVGLGGLTPAPGEDAKVDQEASALWFDAATGILLKARIAAVVGTMELILREAEGAPQIGGRRV